MPSAAPRRSGGKPETEPYGDDAAGRGPRDQIEVTADRMFEVLFEARQERGRKHAADATAIER